MSTEMIAHPSDDIPAALLEKVLLGGDLGALSAPERMAYYSGVCKSLNLNPLTRPFEYLKLSGKLVLYARRDAADQLRNLHGISITRVDVTYQDDLVVVTVSAQTAHGRTDTDVGVVALSNTRGEARANLILKAVTKGKRRVTLSICGLGFLDETEVDTIPGAQVVVEPQGQDEGTSPTQTATLRLSQPPAEPGGHSNDADAAPAGHAAQTAPERFVEAAAEALSTQSSVVSRQSSETGSAPRDLTTGDRRPATAADPQAALRAEVVALCSADGAALEVLRKAAGGKVPQEWTEEQLRKALPWLRKRVPRSQQLSGRIATARTDEELQALLTEAQEAKDQRAISQVEYLGLHREAQTRKAALSGPLTAGAGLGVAS